MLFFWKGRKIFCHMKNILCCGKYHFPYILLYLALVNRGCVVNPHCLLVWGLENLVSGVVTNPHCLIAWGLENLVNGVVINPMVPFDCLVPSELKSHIFFKIPLVWEKKICL